MSWITHVTPESASPALKVVYDRILANSTAGRISNLWLTCGHDPAGLDQAYDLHLALTRAPAPLTRAQSELIALVVSATNGCGYCVAHHGPHLAREIGEPMARAVARDYREANLAARDRILLDAAVALTCEPCERKLEDVERMREYGFDDAAILKATEIASYFNYVNRLACSLGVELEPDVAPWEFGAQR